jgi:hypothetical protein
VDCEGIRIAAQGHQPAPYGHGRQISSLLSSRNGSSVRVGPWWIRSLVHCRISRFLYTALHRCRGSVLLTDRVLICLFWSKCSSSRETVSSLGDKTLGRLTREDLKSSHLDSTCTWELGPCWWESGFRKGPVIERREFQG